MTILEGVGLAVSVTTLISMMFFVYRSFRDPDVKNEKKIALLEQRVKLQELAFNKDVNSINNNLKLLRVNHIHHMESDIKGLDNKMGRVLYILEGQFEVVKK